MDLFNFTTTGQKVIVGLIIASIGLYIISKWLKKKTKEYYSQEYWENRYSWYSQEMDWYTNFDQVDKDFNIQELIKEKFPNNFFKKKILEMGCGNSTLSSEMYKKGFRDITAIDFSNVVIKRMCEKYSNTKIKFRCVDFNRMDEFFEKEEFDIIIEKAGLDSIATKGTSDVPEMLLNVYMKMHSILKKDGIVLSMSTKNVQFWRKSVFDCLGEKKLFEFFQTKKTVFTSKNNPELMNLYFFYLKKI